MSCLKQNSSNRRKSLRRAALSGGLLLTLCLGAGAMPDWLHPEAAPEDALSLPSDLTTALRDWVLSDQLEPVEDELLGQRVWENPGAGVGWIRSRRSFDGDYEVRARVRLMDPHGQTAARLATGARGPMTDPATVHALNYQANRQVTPVFDIGNQFYLRDETLLRDQAGKWVEHRVHHTLMSRPWWSSAAFVSGQELRHPPNVRSAGQVPSRTLVNRFGSVSPLWAESWRHEIESALNALPAVDAQWSELRIVRRSGSARLYFDGMLIAENRRSAGLPGAVFLRLNRRVRVASIKVLPLPAAPARFHPVPLSFRANAQAAGSGAQAVLADDALPPAGSRGSIQAVPFEFADRRNGFDHVDLSQSLFRYRNLFGHIQQQNVWPAPQVFDPARITFSVPNRPYARLWLVAAFDGREHTLPVVTARFYRSSGGGAGFPIDAAAEAPALTATSAPGAAVPLPVTTAAGAAGNLWLLPIDLDAAAIASELRDEATFSLELTKAVHPFRGYPDPADFGHFQGGLPSGVRVFAMTLETAPLRLITSGNRHGNTYVTPEQPVWLVDLESLRDAPVQATVRLTVTDPYGAAAGVYEREAVLGPFAKTRLEIPLATTLNGLHQVLTEVEVADPAVTDGTQLARPGAFVQLPPDERRATAQNSRWGLWNWLGGHGTHADLKENLYLLRAVGARYGPPSSSPGPRMPPAEVALMQDWGVRVSAAHIGGVVGRSAPAWSYEHPYDPAQYADFRERAGRHVATEFAEIPGIPSWSMFVETAITAPLTYGTPRRYIGEDPAWSEDEARRVRAFMVSGQAICEGIREQAPEAKIALGWGGAGLTIPLLESGFPRELFDWIGVDEPVFSRTPEMPIREVAPNRMWLLRQAMLEHGYADVPVIHTESYYPSSNPLALGWRRSADHYVRLSLLSVAMMPDTTFVACFSVHDCGARWGNQHYGEHGIVSRYPEYNPKPALPAYATMTRLLDPGEFQGFLPTGSHSAYGLHFTSNGRNVYPLWTINGRREARLRFLSGEEPILVDESGNEFPLEQDPAGWVSVALTPTPLWIVSERRVQAVELGEMDHAFVRQEEPLMEAIMGGRRVEYRPENQVAPGDHQVLLDAFETAWTYVPGPHARHAAGHWGMPRHDGPMRSEIVPSDDHNAPVWQITLDDPAVERPLTAWYGVFEPAEPIEIPGKARALGVWADGRSNWGRIVYEVEDAGGEIWRSIGTQDDWNCDDVHTWSYFNFDGWRYLEFPLPSHLPYDNYREHDTTWWGSDGGDGIVQLPLKLRRIIIEQRTHNLYVDELVEVADRSVRLHRLMAVYDNAEAMTDAPVALQRAAAELLSSQWADKAVALPNPVATLRETGAGEPTAFLDLAPPDEYDGLVTQLEIRLQPIEGAREYRVYVAAYEDGSGAQRVAHGPEPTLIVRRLQPGFPLYLFATYTDAENREAKPTPARRILLIDDFPFK